MATFAKAGFNAAKYSAFRPSYPTALFDTVLKYHNSSKGPSKEKGQLLDIGCGHGLISRQLSPYFSALTAIDPSPSMITQASKITDPKTHPNIKYLPGSAEDLEFLPDSTLEMVVAGQAAHWFDYSKAWPELARVVKPGGTLAFWGYKDNYFVDFPQATKVLDEYCYGVDSMGPYWEQPGRNLLRDLYRDIIPPEDKWDEVTRIEYEPVCEGKGRGKGEVLMGKKLKLGEVEGYVRTFSAYHNWMDKHPQIKSRKDGGSGDIVDELFDEMRAVEPEWKKMGENWRDLEVENEWGSAILMAKRRHDDIGGIDAKPIAGN